MQDDRTSPLSYRVNIARLPARGMPVTVEAGPEQLAALAAAHGLVAVEALHADLTVSNWKRGGVHVSGKVRADIVQKCVVTLEALPARVDEDILAHFVPDGSPLLRPDAGEGGEILLDAEGPDSPEPFTGNEIDVGHLVEEFFVLGIDPYPRKAGVALETPGPGDAAGRGPLHDKLKHLRDRD